MALRDWRNAADYADLEHIDGSGLAWEFLRRNPDYRAAVLAAGGDADAAAARWGLRFALDPAADGFAAGLFWRAEVAPAHVLTLVRSPLGGVSRGRLLTLSCAWRADEEGLHLRLPGGLQLVVPAAAATHDPLALAAPLDPQLAQRLAASAALDRALREQPAPPRTLALHRRRRFSTMLRTLDGRDAGASYRSLAEHLYGPAVVDPGTWRTSSVRDVVVRLVRGAVRMARGGYVGLLRTRG